MKKFPVPSAVKINNAFGVKIRNFRNSKNAIKIEDESS
jgi:hypothetical protein